MILNTQYGAITYNKAEFSDGNSNELELQGIKVPGALQQKINSMINSQRLNKFAEFREFFKNKGFDTVQDFLKANNISNEIDISIILQPGYIESTLFVVGADKEYMLEHSLEINLILTDSKDDILQIFKDTYSNYLDQLILKNTL